MRPVEMVRKISDSEFRTLVSPILGLPAWDVVVGLGSFLTMSYGSPVTDSRGRTHGEWYLWLFCSSWELHGEHGVVTTSDGLRENLEAAAARLEGREILSFEVARATLETVLVFDGGFSVRIVPWDSDDDEHWFLWIPSGDVITAGPGRELTVEPSSARGPEGTSR
jgi:hypothetical protein